MYQLAKRIMDILGGLLGLIIFALAYVPITIAIKSEDRGPILVGLTRVSGGAAVRIYKFRSMLVGAALLKPALAHLNERADGSFFKIKNDPRLTRIGKIIRRYRLDELPQFINVLKGDLSLVGPRPHEPAEVAAYPAEFKTLPLAKAGITGLSQVNGASSLSFLKELELDKKYLERQSLWLDLKIIAKTVAIMLFDPTAV